MTTEIFLKENITRKLVALAANLFLIFGLWLIPDNDALPHMPSWYNQIDYYLTLILALPLLWQLWRLFKNTGLTFNEKGVEENLSTLKLQKYSWNEITSIRFMKTFFLSYMLIYLADPMPHVKSKNIYKRLALMANLNKFGTPIKIPVHGIDKSIQEISAILSSYTADLAVKQKAELENSQELS